MPEIVIEVETKSSVPQGPRIDAADETEASRKEKDGLIMEYLSILKNAIMSKCKELLKITDILQKRNVETIGKNDRHRAAGLGDEKLAGLTREEKQRRRDQR